MPVPLEAILKDTVYEPHLVQRISQRKPADIHIVPPDPAWPSIFQTFQRRISSALGGTAQAINHVGSTSVPGLPAKDCIDIDLVVADINDEAAYVPALEAAGFQFILKEPHWHEHRFFCAYEPRVCNLHVWGKDCPEVERHRIFRKWLCKSEKDRKLYASIKEKAAKETLENGGTGMDYNARKENVVREILQRAFADLGYV